VAAIFLLQVNLALAVEPAASVQAPAAVTAPALVSGGGIPFGRLQHSSRNPIDAYRGDSVPPPSMANSVRLGTLVRDGKIYLSLRNAIDLALENNLDLVIARYNLPIAQMDVLRTSTRAWFQARPAAVVQAQVRVQARAALRAAPGARARALRASFLQRSEPAPLFQVMTRSSAPTCIPTTLRSN
jgi:hypothetical protein